MAESLIISSVGHVLEPPDLWTTRIDRRFRDRAPHVVREEQGDYWYCEGRRLAGLHIGTQAGRRFEGLDNANTDRWEDTRPGGYIPEEHVKDMEVEGIYGGVLYPTAGNRLWDHQDGSLLNSIWRAYNEWLAEFCGAYPDRLKGVAPVNVDDVEEGIGQLRHARKLGLAGAMIPVSPPADRCYNLPEYEPFWATVQDLEMPLSLKPSTLRPGPTERLPVPDLAFYATQDHLVRRSLAHMIYSGVFDRYPELMVGAVEYEVAWIPHFLDRMDYWYVNTHKGFPTGIPFKNAARPSDFFHSNVFCTFQEDALGIQQRHLIGVDSLMWGWDYPHIAATFPKTRETLDRIFEGVPEQERRKILGENAAKVYHFSPAVVR